MKRYLYLPLLVLLLLGVAALGYAQTPTTGNLRGKVTDKTGAILPGVAVTISSPVLIQPQLVTTASERGLFRFPAIPPGLYTIRFELSGFTPLVREEIKVNLGLTTSLNAQMEIAGVEEVITVTGEGPLIDVKSTEVGNVFTTELMENIPGARHIWELMNQTPGLRPDRLDVGGSTFGTQWGTGTYGLPSQNRTMYDGINTTEGTGGAGMYMDFGSFEEVQISTASNKAEMPHPGKLLMVIMKSGGNEFHGHVYFDYENPGWQDTNDTQELINKGLYWSDLNDNGKWDPGEGGLRLKMYHEFNAGLGGPIMKDKAWFYMNGRRRRYARYPVGLYYPDGKRGYEDTWLTNFAAKVTLQLSDKDKIIGMFEWDYKEYPFRGAASYRPPDSSRYQKSPTYNFLFTWNHIFNPNTFIENRFGRYYYWWRDEAYSKDVSVYNYDTDTYSGAVWYRGIDWQADDGRWQDMFNISHYRDDWAGGDHDIKVGVEILNEWWMAYYGGWTDDVRLEIYGGKGDTVELCAGPGTSWDRLWHIGAFIDDSLSISERLTLNLGLRFDYYSNYYPAQHRDGNRWVDPIDISGSGSLMSWTPISPRIGLIYDLTGDGKTAVKASYGRFWHNPSYYVSYYANPNQQAYILHYWNDINNNLIFDGPQEVGAYISESGGARASVDPDLKQAHTDEFVVQFEREIMPNYSVRVGYVYKNIRDYWESFDIARPYKPEQWATAYEPVTAVDPGPDGEVGTPDDAGTITLYNLLEVYPSNPTVANFPNYKEHWSNIEFTLIKRMSRGFQFNATFFGTWRHDYIHWNSPIEPNRNLSGLKNGYRDVFDWCFKFYGSYLLPYDFQIGWNFNILSGTKWAREVSFFGYYDDPVNLTGYHRFNQGSLTIHPEEWGSRQYDTYKLLNVRLDKIFKVKGDMRLIPFFELSNVFNTNTILESRYRSGSRFNRPDRIPMPRIIKLGIRFQF